MFAYFVVEPSHNLHVKHRHTRSCHSHGSESSNRASGCSAGGELINVDALDQWSCSGNV